MKKCPLNAIKMVKGLLQEFLCQCLDSQEALSQFPDCTHRDKGGRTQMAIEAETSGKKTCYVWKSSGIKLCIACAH